jgi:hypothetical protein
MHCWHYIIKHNQHKYAKQLMQSTGSTSNDSANTLLKGIAITAAAAAC